MLIRERAVWALGAASVAEIDRLNTWPRAISPCAGRCGGWPFACPPAGRVLVDGHLDPALGWPCRCIVGGDALIPEISAASIVAKVARDRLLQRLGLRIRLRVRAPRGLTDGGAQGGAGAARHLSAPQRQLRPVRRALERCGEDDPPPRHHRYIAAAPVTSTGAKYRGGVGEIISPTSFLLNTPAWRSRRRAGHEALGRIVRVTAR